VRLVGAVEGVSSALLFLLGELAQDLLLLLDEQLLI
jgi:hypothetical protein